MKTYKCLRCNRKWIPRKDSPKNCPKCNSPYWNKKRVQDKPPKIAPDRCPQRKRK
jgi:DNA-directed RNA polymerase subunit RPC12/RpoP